MLTDLQEAWLLALESGKYTQTKGILKRDVPVVLENAFGEAPAGHCCLGVALEVMGVEYTPAFGSLTQDQAKMLGISEHGLGSCIKMNDNLGMDFVEIAAEIRRNPKKFFKETKCL